MRAKTPGKIQELNKGDQHEKPHHTARWDSDGKIYKMSDNGVWQYSGQSWLLSGAAADYYLWRTIVSGVLTNDDGDGNQLDTDDLDYWISNNVDWFEREANVTFSISDDSAGANILASRTYYLSAYKTGTGSPP